MLSSVDTGHEPDELVARWRAVAGQTPGSHRLGSDLLRRYVEPHRHYHDTRHLLEVLAAIDELGGSDAVFFAAWFHDAVYEPARTDNEERSALLGERALSALGQPVEVAREVGRLVRLTTAHDPPAGDRAGAVLCDADLWILAAGWERYAQYVAAIRAEYAEVGDEAFAAGRSAILSRLLKRPVVYRTPEGRDRWERAARANLTRELSALRAGAGDRQP